MSLKQRNLTTLFFHAILKIYTDTKLLVVSISRVFKNTFVRVFIILVLKYVLLKYMCI